MLSVLSVADLPGADPVQSVQVPYSMAGLVESLTRLATQPGHGAVGTSSESAGRVESRDVRGRPRARGAHVDVSFISELGVALASRLETELPGDLVQYGASGCLGQLRRALKRAS
jgi:hypothetical protein